MATQSVSRGVRGHDARRHEFHLCVPAIGSRDTRREIMKTRKPELKIMTPKREPAPDWVWSTPWEIEYSLSMINDGGEDTERIDLTRDEYISIKHHLARLRGYDLSSV